MIALAARSIVVVWWSRPLRSAWCICLAAGKVSSLSPARSSSSQVIRAADPGRRYDPPRGRPRSSISFGSRGAQGMRADISTCIAAFSGANLFHAKLHAAVELVARGAHLDDAARQRRLNGAIPHLRVDRAGFIGQRHIQIVLAVGAGALLGGADDQVALEAVVALDIRLNT